MPLTTAGISAILDDGNEATIWVAIGDGATSADQTSNERVQLTSSVANGVVTATGVPYEYTGEPGAGATHALLFSAETDGTFLGSEALSGDQTFNVAGAYNLAGLTITGSSS